MPDLSEILRVDDRVLDFARDIEVIQSLEIIVTTYREKRREIADLGLSDVFEFIDSIEQDEAFFNALGNIGLDGDELKGHVTKVSETLGKISEEQRKLIHPLSDFDEQENGKDQGLIDWNILDAGTAGAGGGSVKYGFQLSASATLEFEAGDAWPGESSHVSGDLLRVGIAGALAASGNAELPLSVGSVKIGTDNSLSSSIDYFFSPADSDQLYAAAIARSLDDLCNPFSLGSVWKALAGSDLSAVIAQVDGSTSFDVEVGISEGFTLAHDIKASAGITVKANVKKSAAYDLSVAALPAAGGAAQQVEVILSRNSLLTRGAGVSLGVEIDMGELAKRLREILKRHQAAFQGVLDEYEDYLTPGTYVRNALQAELKDRVEALTDNQAIQDSLKDAVQGFLGTDRRPTMNKLRQEISKQVTAKLDALGEVVTGNADVVAAELAGKIAEEIGLDATEAIESLTDELATLVSSVQDDLKSRVTNLTDPALDDLVEKLEKAGAKVSDAVAKADAALKGVREIVGKYETLLKKLIAETGNAARAKITARIAREEKRTDGQVVDVRMIISANTPAARDAFDTVVSGKLENIVEILRQEEPMPGVTFDKNNMELARVARLHRTIGFDVVLLGFEFSTQSIFDTDARVSSDGAGRVSVTSNATWTKRKTTKKEEREVQFVDAFELAAASATKELSVDLSINHQDQDLEAEELRKFVRSFEDAGLLAQGTTERALDTLRDWNLGRSAKKVKADIDLALRLDQKASTNLLRLGDRTNGGRNSGAARALFEIALQELKQSGAYTKEKVSDIAKTVLEQTGNADRGDTGQETDILLGYKPRIHRQLMTSAVFRARDLRTRNIRTKLEQASELHNLCMDYAEFVDIMADIYEAKPVLIDADGWSESDYIDHQDKLNKRIKRWLMIGSKAIFWISDEAHPRTVAFVGALVETARDESSAESPPALTLTMVRRNGDRAVVTLA